MAIEYLDGIRFYRSISAGMKRVVSRQDYLNKINVFPVPDQDTGTNMAYTLTCIEEYINGKINPSIRHMSLAVADSALDGARGNSGAILAQFFVGFADGIKDNHIIKTAQFSEAVKVAKAYAYEALVVPQEGTILTVMSDWSREIEKLSEKIGDFRILFERALIRARQSLLDTPKKLEILAKSGVVDAGAQGFLDMLEGINDFLKEGVVTP
ncbi:MAG: DAK2 domain-containing protein, partial [Candidatus Neomarinimicrobiota bacterium]